jgi:diaminopimelate decarboxylase
MSSAYNMRPPAPEVMASGGRFAVIRARESLEALIARDRVPEWLG